MSAIWATLFSTSPNDLRNAADSNTHGLSNQIESFITHQLFTIYKKSR